MSPLAGRRRVRVVSATTNSALVCDVEELACCGLQASLHDGDRDPHEARRVQHLRRDLLQEAEFLAARKGEAHVQELRQVKAELHAWWTGEKSAAFDVKRRRTADLEALLEGLRRQ